MVLSFFIKTIKKDEPKLNGVKLRNNSVFSPSFPIYYFSQFYVVKVRIIIYRKNEVKKPFFSPSFFYIIPFLFTSKRYNIEEVRGEK
jgi:hypothetical protein